MLPDDAEVMQELLHLLDLLIKFLTVKILKLLEVKLLPAPHFGRPQS